MKKWSPFTRLLARSLMWLRLLRLSGICALCGICAAFGIAAAHPQEAAETAASTTFPLQTSPHMRWSTFVTMQVGGRPLQVAQFESDWPFERLAAELSRGQRHFQVLTRLPGQWLLSGQWAGQHWLAQIRVQERTQRHGSRGQMSRWQMSAPAVTVRNPALEAFSGTSWLGPPVMHVRFTDQGQKVEHAIFPVTPGLAGADSDRRSSNRPDSSQPALQALSQHLEQLLDHAGWQRGQASAWFAPAGQSWQLGKQTLFWQIYPNGSGLAVFVQHQAGPEGVDSDGNGQ